MIRTLHYLYIDVTDAMGASDDDVIAAHASDSSFGKSCKNSVGVHCVLLIRDCAHYRRLWRSSGDHIWSHHTAVQRTSDRPIKPSTLLESCRRRKINWRFQSCNRDQFNVPLSLLEDVGNKPSSSLWSIQLSHAPYGGSTLRPNLRFAELLIDRPE